ncbi:polysaccharide biosynthesis protein [Amycolatopsis japonica]|uniref:polysaccharide biosynthesis protein n=1 Tax=Amycolatopsis japonica TaxID=208439 RepID=UPI0033D0CE5E
MIRSEIVASLQEASIHWMNQKDAVTFANLQHLTRELVQEHQDTGLAEYNRFLGIATRRLQVDNEKLRDLLSGCRVLITGGTGCVGSELLGAVAQFTPAQLTSVSRGITTQYPRLKSVRYVHADISHEDEISKIFASERPHIVFHLAAQRDPGAAEADPIHTIQTNLIGTGNVIKACESVGVDRLVYASTGKALRPFSSDVYVSTKRAAEFLVSTMNQRGVTRGAAARFTHIVNNSIVLAKILSAQRSSAIKLHAPSIGFYAQSATEAAHLLLNSASNASRDMMMNHSIRDLDWPVDLLDFTIGALASNRIAAPIYLGGFDPGYEPTLYPGLYDPDTAGSISPLISSIEAHSLSRSGNSAVDAFTCTSNISEGELREIARIRIATCVETARVPLRRLSILLLDRTLRTLTKAQLQRTYELASRSGQAENADHEIITKKIISLLGEFECSSSSTKAS